MTSPRRARREANDSGGNGYDSLTGGASLKGGVLIAVAVVLGIVLLGKGFDSGFIPSSSSDPSDEVATGGGDDEGEDGEETTTTAATATTHQPAEVRVQVLNSTGPSGSAGAGTDALSAVGYNVIDGANAADRNATATAIYAAPGFEGDAAAIASVLGISAAPQAMPNPPPPPAPADASVVVVLGPDFALPAAGTTTTTTG
jgi:LytR cell envelope-related transcriptional attenuator